MTSIISLRDLTNAVRARRRELGLTQAEVAQRARVSRRWIGEFEMGKPAAELQLVLRLLDALELDLAVAARGRPHSDRVLGREAIDLDAVLERYRT